MLAVARCGISSAEYGIGYCGGNATHSTYFQRRDRAVRPFGGGTSGVDRGYGKSQYWLHNRAGSTVHIALWAIGTSLGIGVPGQRLPHAGMQRAMGYRLDIVWGSLYNKGCPWHAR